MKTKDKVSVIKTCFFYLVLTIILTASVNTLYGQTVKEELPKEMIEQRNNNYRSELEAYLRNYLIDEYDDRARDAWNRDYSSVEAFERSVADNRMRWNEILNPPRLIKTGNLRKEPDATFTDIKAEWLELPLGGITAKAFIAFPENASPENPVPIIIAQHGIGSSPERIFIQDGGIYHAYGRELLNAGFAVLAPMNLYSVPHRNYIERMCRLADMTLPGIELARLQHLLDIVLEDPRVDGERVGMWGVSLGGMATMFWMPLESRIKVGVVSAWFNHRRNKMIIPDDHYTSFIAVNEEHAFFRGWLTEFTDHDAVSLICPRPLLIQHGKSDRIAHWPQLVEEYKISKIHYEKLNIGDRIEMDLFEGGHEPRIESAIPFLKKWLQQ